ncbi:uncharacterized protein MONOS_3315 [Monocercomonoides exilis]|uniref:uncharacterized protein n=1 Tax=Monocercomonoides exilis TaxID=2049356 RepID=UPI00355950CB|nr:hypothetical protein MONOS_3315 [Monocercomonoides exilis]|eukprot:MONOS_3315.1-p1 / transcript=MONOS_3315.1 / gene=MONOS_3315 / organism=Monocercomonoides_exilis_PA203 / gene_product=unspecified product / transcript_product=unspecified product / location=Mono_scaffold00077:37105-38103(-) / protein_length=228 / sequence_SO=supercontig / SO=protein_coding / is_pseudo=false
MALLQSQPLIIPEIAVLPKVTTFLSASILPYPPVEKIVTLCHLLSIVIKSCAANQTSFSQKLEKHLKDELFSLCAECDPTVSPLDYLESLGLLKPFGLIAGITKTSGDYSSVNEYFQSISSMEEGLILSEHIGQKVRDTSDQVSPHKFVVHQIALLYHVVGQYAPSYKPMIENKFEELRPQWAEGKLRQSDVEWLDNLTQSLLEHTFQTTPDTIPRLSRFFNILKLP